MNCSKFYAMFNIVVVIQLYPAKGKPANKQSRNLHPIHNQVRTGVKGHTFKSACLSRADYPFIIYQS
jgi:hypothetical protein